ncbi:MAG: helix-turn-helix transcriptional regulator [Opitutaceae bacterium]
MNFTAMSDKAILAELGGRIQKERLNQNTTQAALVQRAGVARKVVQQLEAGRGCTLENLLRILRALGRLDQLDSLLPDPGISPVQLARLAGRRRQRASGRRERRPEERR